MTRVLCLYLGYTTKVRLFDYFWHKYLNRPYRLRVTIDEGTGTHAVVLLHGIGASGQVWRPLVDQLDHAKNRIIAVDLLGFGESPKPDWNEYSVDEHARAVLHTLRRKGVTGRITIVAHSMGCLVASHLAATNKSKLRRLVLYEPPLLADQPKKRTHRWRQQRYLAFLEYISNHPELLMLQHRRLWRWAQKLSGLVMDEKTWLPFERSLRNTIMRQEAFRELREIKVPTDIIYGRLDFVVIRSGVKQDLQDNPYIRLQLVSEMHDITNRAARAIASVLGQKPPKPAPTKMPVKKATL